MATIRRSPWTASLALLGLVVASPSARAEPTFGQIRDYPVPVPAHYPRLNVGPRPVGGGALTPWVIFVNYDGASLTGGADNALENVTQIGEMVGNFESFGPDVMMRTAILQAVRTDFEAYNISVVDARPEAGQYSMTMVGPTNPFGANVLGRAPLDCGNQQTHSNVSFAYHSAGDGFGATTVAATISHEQGHTFGLDHVNNPPSMLNPANEDPDPGFLDQCFALTDGPGAFCSQIHAQYCSNPTPEQNSHLELLAMFGPAIPDVDPPVIIITSPINGSTFASGEGFTVLATITDDSPVPDADLYIDGVLREKDTLEPWGWQVNGLPDGIYTLELVASDENGNEGLSVPVSVLVGDDDDDDDTDGDTAGADDGTGGGDDDDDDDDADTDGDTAGADGDAGGCGCTQSPGPRPWQLAGPLLLVLGLRRRR